LPSKKATGANRWPNKKGTGTMKNTTMTLTEVNTTKHSAPAGELSSLTSYTNEGRTVRASIDQQGYPVVITKDICDVFEITHYRNALDRIPDWAKGCGVKVNTPGGVQEMATLKESGVYWLALRSTKPEAQRFTRWVCEEVLPSIRKNGFYQSEGIDPRIARIEQAQMLRARRDAILAQIRANKTMIAILEELGDDSCTVREALDEAGEDMPLLGAITRCLAYARRNYIPVGKRKGRMIMPRVAIRAALNLDQHKLPLGDTPAPRKPAKAKKGGAKS